MKQAGFYMIYVEGGNSPTYKHDSFESASKEAYRLAGTTGKEVFYSFYRCFMQKRDHNHRGL